MFSGATAIGLSISGPIWEARSCSYSGSRSRRPAIAKVASTPNLVTPMWRARGAGSSTAPKPEKGVSEVCCTSVPPSAARLRSAPTSSIEADPRGPEICAEASSSGAAARTPGIARTRRSIVSGKPCGSRASSCRVAFPTIPRESCATEEDRLEVATCEANRSATPAAMPSTAKPSWSARARRRTR